MFSLARFQRVLTIVSLITLALATRPIHATTISGPITYPANGHQYYLLSKDTWTSSEGEAMTLGGHLVTINDSAENQFLVDTFVLNGHQSDPLWIGINDVASEGSFVWVSGEPVTFTNWQVGEPNDFQPEGGEDFGTINWHFAAQQSDNHSLWNDTPNTGTMTFNDASDGPYFGIAEVPEPTSRFVLLIGVAGPLLFRRLL